MSLPARLSPLLLALGLVTAAAETKEVVGVLGSSVLLDPELKVDPSKNEILWTFITRSILHHVPGHISVEPNEQFKSRLQFNTSNGALMVNGLKPRDQGDYTFIVGGRELRTIQLLLFEKLSEPSLLTNTRSLGFTVQLTCGVSGDPHDYQWQKDGGELSQHHQLIDGNRTLVIPSASTGDCGLYTCVAFNPVSSIQANYTLILVGLSLEDVLIVAVSAVGLLISSASLLLPAVLLDYWRWKTLGALLGIPVYCLSLSICNVAFFVAIYIAFSDWILIKGLSALDIVVVVALITGLRLSTAFVNASNLAQTGRSDQVSQRIRKGLKWLSICKAVAFNCVFVTFVIKAIITGLSTKDTVTVALSITVLVLPLVILVIMVRLLQKNSDQAPWRTRSWSSWLLIYTDILLTVLLIIVTLNVLITGSYAKDIVAVAVSITMLVLLLTFFIPLVYLLRKMDLFQEIFPKWLSIYKAGYLIVILIAVISWMAVKGLAPEGIVIVATSTMGLGLSTAHAIVFLCWTLNGSSDKWWWWCLNICNIVCHVSILVALICWIVFKDQGCDSNVPTWSILIASMVTCAITLSRSFPVCHSKNKGTNRDNSAEREQDNGEVQELQTIRPDEAKPENLQPD